MMELSYSENQNNLISNIRLWWLLLKEWKCVAVGHHKDLGKVIEDWGKSRLEPSHLYCCSNASGNWDYSLFAV